MPNVELKSSVTNLKVALLGLGVPKNKRDKIMSLIQVVVAKGIEAGMEEMREAILAAAEKAGPESNIIFPDWKVFEDLT